MTLRRLSRSLLASSFLLAAAMPLAAQTSVTGTQGGKMTVEALENFDGAWAMTFLPDGRALVTEKSGSIWLLNTDGSKAGEISGGPSVEARGQGGLGDE